MEIINMDCLNCIKNRAELAKLFADKGFKIGAEVGVADGRYSKVLCETIDGLKLYCIDPYKPYKGNRRGGPSGQHENNFALAQERLNRYGVTFLRWKSMEAVQQIDDGSLDFVYIDGNHDFDYVMEDIINWARKVKKGGIVAGHDYYHFRNSGVIEAVDYYVKIHNLDLYTTKQGHDRGELSWFFIKP